MKTFTYYWFFVILFLFLVFFIVYLNQTEGYFIFSEPKMKKTYVSFRFDDGLKSQIKALKILEENNLTASLYVITSKLNSSSDWEKEYFLSLEEIKNLSERFEIGSHTRNHLNLLYLNENSLEEEIIGSKEDLSKFGIKATTFVYPGGNYNYKVIKIVEENYDCASTQDVGVNSIPIRPHLLKDFTFRKKNTNETIRRVIKEGSWNILTFHDIGEIEIDGMPPLFKKVASSNSVNEDLFKEIVKYIKENNIEVITIGEGCRRFKNEKK